MFLTALTFIAALLIEGLGTIISIIGFSAFFGSNPIIIALAAALDLGKIVVVTMLYKHWGSMNVLMRGYALSAALVTMIITSAGAAGYLSAQFQTAIIGTQEGQLKVQVLKEEQQKLELRKKQIDDQIANLPANFSRGRVALMKQFEAEQKQVTDRLTAISQELPTLQVTQISADAKAGPILYLAKAFDVPIEEAVKWVILLIIFVFDPLAVFLLVAGNFLLERRAKMAEPDEQLEEPTAPPVDNEPVVFGDGTDYPPLTAADDAKLYEVLSRYEPEAPEVVSSPEPALEQTTTLLPHGSASEVQDHEPLPPTHELPPIPVEDTVEAAPAARREEITEDNLRRPAVSSLEKVEPDSGTSLVWPGEVGYGTGAFVTQPKRD